MNGTLAGIIIAVIIDTVVEWGADNQVNKGVIVKIDLLQNRTKASYIDAAMLRVQGKAHLTTKLT